MEFSYKNGLKEGPATYYFQDKSIEVKCTDLFYSGSSLTQKLSNERFLDCYQNVYKTINGQNVPVLSHTKK